MHVVFAEWRVEGPHWALVSNVNMKKDDGADGRGGNADGEKERERQRRRGKQRARQLLIHTLTPDRPPPGGNYWYKYKY